MTIKQAFQILDKACGNYRGTREEHLGISKALDVIAQFILKYSPKEELVEKQPMEKVEPVVT